MKKVRDDLIALKASPLYAYRVANGYFPVAGQGNHDADIMFIGEAPGETEAKTGIPFCGRAGKMLDELLSHINLNREDVYITNIVKDRPQENRDPTPEEIHLYSPFLDRQIEIIEPRAIVTLGRFAMEYIFNHFDLSDRPGPISSMRGQVFEVDALGKHIKIIPLFHPAVALYDGSKREVLKADFEKLKEVTDTIV